MTWHERSRSSLPGLQQLEQALTVPLSELSGTIPDLSCGSQISTPSDPPGHHRFDVLEQLGGGLNATVVRAEDNETGEEVALKIFAATDERAAEHTEEELQTIFDMSNVIGTVPARDFGVLETKDGLHRFATLKLAERGTLADHLNHNGVMSVDDVARMALSIIPALKGLKHRGEVHRDIGDNNIFLGATGRFLLGDFGSVGKIGEIETPDKPFAAQAERYDAKSNDTLAMIGGKKGFIAPERMRGNTRLGPESDVYSLGGVMFLALTAKFPYPTHSFGAYQHAVLHEEPTPARIFRPSLTPGVNLLLAEMMAKDPRDRPDLDEAEDRLFQILLDPTL